MFDASPPFILSKRSLRGGSDISAPSEEEASGEEALRSSYTENNATARTLGTMG